MATIHREHVRLIPATSEACFAAIADFESYPEWQTAVRSCVVEERDSCGRGTVVATTIDAKVRQVHYRLLYEFDPPSRIAWRYVDGDVRDLSGHFEFVATEDGGCLATFALAVDPGRFVPGFVRDVLSNVLMRSALEDLATRVGAP